MYYIKKYADCWAVHNDNNGQSRPLTETEKEVIKKEYPTLEEKGLRTLYSDEIKSISNLP
jgi:hypothetical protein